MPCFDPGPGLMLEIYPQWLCQAFKFLTKEELLSIKGILSDWEDESAFEWYMRHLKEERNKEELLRLING